MLLGTRMTNNEPSAIRDLDVVARYDATDPAYVVKDSSNRISALLDKSKRLQTSTILDSGNLTINKVYIIVATTVDYFGTGRIVGNMFVAATALALSANNSVREVLGNHITQTGTTKMPIHTNRYNLLTYSEDFSNAAWIKQGTTIIPNQAIAPNGSMTASLMYPATSGSYRGIRQSGNLKDMLSLSIYAKAQNKKMLSFHTFDDKRLMFDLISGEKIYDTSIGINSTIEPVGNDWFRISLMFNKSVDSPNNIYIYITDDGTNTSATANGTDGIYIWGAQIEQSNFAGKYQRVNAANDYDTNGFEYYAQFDGVDDSLKSLPFTLNQPTSIYGCLKQNSWVDQDRIWDAIMYSYGTLLQRVNIGALRMYAGGNLVDNNTKSIIGMYDNISTCYNGVDSYIKINNLAKVTGNPGTLNMGGFTLASHTDGTNNSNIAVKEIIIKSIATDESDTIFNYFKNKHNVQY